MGMSCTGGNFYRIVNIMTREVYIDILCSKCNVLATRGHRINLSFKFVLSTFFILATLDESVLLEC